MRALGPIRLPRHFEWREVKGYEGLYWVSEIGTVWSRYKQSELVPWLHRCHTCKYHKVELFKQGVSRRRYVHELVCEAWHGPRPIGLQVRHLDGNSLNNSAVNVLWGTPKENSWDRMRGYETD